MRAMNVRMETKKYNPGKGRLAWITLFMLTAVFLLSFFRIQRAEAAEVSNTYALTLSTGATGTKFSNFQYIAVHYTDSSGTARTHYLLSDLAETRSKTILNGLQPDAAIRKRLTSAMGYTFAYEEQGLFDAYSTSTLYFQPDYTVGSITGVDFLTKTTDRWSCEGEPVPEGMRRKGSLARPSTASATEL